MPNFGKIKTNDRNAISFIHASTEKLQLKIEREGWEFRLSLVN